MPLPLESCLNDVAVIRTAFETLESFREIPDMRAELMPLIRDARGNLARRLGESRRALREDQAGSRVPDLRELKERFLQLATEGLPRRTLDRLMCVDVFESVSRVQSLETGRPPEPDYRYELLPQHPLPEFRALPPRAFTDRVFDDLQDALTDDRSYADRPAFNADFVQKFVAVMFCIYVATDPLHYSE